MLANAILVLDPGNCIEGGIFSFQDFEYGCILVGGDFSSINNRFDTFVESGVDLVLREKLHGVLLRVENISDSSRCSLLTVACLLTAPAPSTVKSLEMATVQSLDIATVICLIQPRT
jgi:hypothetical protein